MKYCLHQLFRPTLHFPKDGVGNCTVCTADEANKNCNMYCPVSVTEVWVEDKTLLTNGESYEKEKNA